MTVVTVVTVYAKQGDLSIDNNLGYRMLPSSSHFIPATGPPWAATWRPDGGRPVLLDRHLQAPRHRPFRLSPGRPPSPAVSPRGSARGAAARRLVRVAPRRAAEDGRMHRPRRGRRSRPGHPLPFLEAQPSGSPAGSVDRLRSCPARPTGIEYASAHTIPGDDDPMSTPRPDKTIDDLFAEFLAAQEARLSLQTYSRYEGIIDLYRADPFGRYWGQVTLARTTTRSLLCRSNVIAGTPCAPTTSPPGFRSSSATTCPAKRSPAMRRQNDGDPPRSSKKLASVSLPHTVVSEDDETIPHRGGPSRT